jgi:hypothetical protein
MEGKRKTGWLELNLLEILNEYKDGTDEPLDGDSVERLTEIIKAKLNLFEGNITEKEYEKVLDNSIKKEVRIVRINTTAFEEEDFLLLTDLTDEEIEEVIKPIVEAERNGEDEETTHYDNDSLAETLEAIYPNNVIEHYSIDGIDEITI